VTEQLEDTKPVIGSVEEPLNVQLVALKVPVFELVQLTVPVGAVATTGVVSVTVAVQLEAAPTGTVAGEQLTEVAVMCWFAVTTVVPLDPKCLASPL